MEENLITQIPSLQPSEGQKLQMERKIGMFIHFGVNTFGNVEWSDGEIKALSYQPKEIDADGWVKAAYEAGMNFVVLITKHHDGFCLWDTDTTDYSVKHSKNPTDVVAEVAKACEKYGLKLGLYYSLWDRSDKRYKNAFSEEYIPYMMEQLTELLDGRYGEIVELWFDGAWDKPMRAWRLELLYDLIKRLQPLCQVGVNHTIGEMSDEACFPPKRYLPENYQDRDPIRMFPSDFRLWDPNMCRVDDPKIYTFEGKEYYLPFEMTICSRKEFSWFYSNIYEEKEFLPVEEVVKNCRQLFAQGNCALINLPPNTAGKLVEGDVQHLMEIGRALGISRK